MNSVRFLGTPIVFVLGREFQRPSQEETYPAKPIVLRVVSRFLDCIPPYDCSIPMIVVGSVGGEVDLPQELLLMMLKFAHHFSCNFSSKYVKLQFWARDIFGVLENNCVRNNY